MRITRMNEGMHKSRANALGILGLRRSALGSSLVELEVCCVIIPW